MIIKATEHTSRQVKVEVNPFDVLEALKERAFGILGMPVESYIDHQGRLAENDDDGRGCSWITRVIADKPTAEQVTTIEAFSFIRKVLLNSRVQNV